MTGQGEGRIEALRAIGRGLTQAAGIDLIIHRGGEDCMVHSARTDFNVALAPTTTKVDIEGLESFRARIVASVNGGERLTPAELEAYGRRLASVLFSDSVDQLYRATANGRQVQLSLCATDPALKAIPWEYLTWPDLNAAPHDGRSLSRLVTATLASPLTNVARDDVIRIMLVVSAPADQPAVEWIETRRILEGQVAAYTPTAPVPGRRLEFMMCEASEANDVRTAIVGYDPHVVHFIGHGAPDALVFTRHQPSRSQLVSARMVHNVLASPSTRLIVLSACDTANVGGEIAPLLSIAERLVQAGVPAVIANQMPISLRSIHLFCGAMYRDLLKTGNIDRAVNAGRIAIGIAFDNGAVAAVEWGIPVLYRRPGCSQLFEEPAAP